MKTGGKSFMRLDKISGNSIRYIRGLVSGFRPTQKSDRIKGVSRIVWPSVTLRVVRSRYCTVSAELDLEIRDWMVPCRSGALWTPHSPGLLPKQPRFSGPKPRMWIRWFQHPVRNRICCSLDLRTQLCYFEDFRYIGLYNSPLFPDFSLVEQHSKIDCEVSHDCEQN